MKVKLTFENVINICACGLIFLISFSVTSAINTPSTGYRGIDAANTNVNSTYSNPFDTFVAENAHGFDVFVPTKTIYELITFWDNTPTNIDIYTDKEDLIDITVDPSIYGFRRHSSYTQEEYCDNGSVSPTRATSYGVNQRQYNILEIDVPVDMEGYLNIRAGYDGLGEDMDLFKQKEGGSTVTESRLHRLYDDGAGTTGNAADFDFDNDGTDDIESFHISDPTPVTSGPVIWTDTRIATKIKLFAGINYIRIEGSSPTDAFGCTNNDTSAYTSVGFDPSSIGGEGYVWFSNK